MMENWKKKQIKFKMKIVKCKMAQGKNLNTFLSPASLEAAGNTEKRLISISSINKSKIAFLSASSVGSVRANSFSRPLRSRPQSTQGDTTRCRDQESGIKTQEPES